MPINTMAFPPSFFEILLTYNIVQLKVQNMVIGYTYTLWSDYHSMVS